MMHYAQRELQLNKVYRETGKLRLVHLKTSFTDFGRACRYNNADNKDSLPVILLSSAAKKRCQTDQMTRRGQFKTSGFHKMKPDYDNKMIEDPDTKKKRKVKSKSKASRNDENNEPSESSQIGGQSQNQKIYSKTTLADQPDRYFPQSESVVLSRSQLLFLKVGW